MLFFFKNSYSFLFLHSYRMQVFLLLLCFNLSLAQNATLDTTIALKEFSVEANRYTQNNSGQKSERIDSLDIQAPISQNLADLLAQNNAFFIKSYGLGSLSTGSFRGSSAGQTATLWNGINLQSPMYGLLDYALVPALFLDQVSLSYGGSSALFGSGSVGGTVLLNNKATFNKGVSATILGSIGSFDAYQQGLKIGWSNSKISIHAKLFNHTALNNYPFINTAEIGKPKQFQKNAKLKQQGIFLENYFRLSEKQMLSIRFWYQHNDRQIPASIVSAATKQNQQDEFYRGNLEWNFKSKVNQITFRTAYFDERLNFNDSALSLYSYSRSKSVIAEVEDSYFFTENFYLTTGLNNTYITALSDGYGLEQPKQNRSALFTSLHFNSKNKSWKNRLSLRKEFYGSKQVPITASLGSEKLFFKIVKLRGSVSRNYRLPTFNDLFWIELGAKGNTELKPESGWSADIGLGEILKKENFSIESEVAVFSNSVKNMIVWQPASTGIWSPYNISSVWSRGIEFNVTMKYKIKAILLEIKAKYNHTLSTDNNSIAGNTATYGKQIFYVPQDNYHIETAFTWKGIKLCYTHNYTGKRFIDNENTSYLKSFKTGTVAVSKTIQLKKISMGIFVQVNNVWNQNYQIIAWRPMPLINYQFGVALSLK